MSKNSLSSISSFERSLTGELSPGRSFSFGKADSLYPIRVRVRVRVRVMVKVRVGE